MEKKRFKRQNEQRETMSDVVRICEEADGSVFFEIGSELTTDLAEAVALMMRYPRTEPSLWKKRIQINTETIEPQKALYWLTGGDNEWITLQNYSKPWNQCYLEFQEEYGYMIISILERSKTLNDIRTGFLKHLNLPVLYDFAISKNLVR